MSFAAAADTRVQLSGAETMHEVNETLRAIKCPSPTPFAGRHLHRDVAAQGVRLTTAPQTEREQKGGCKMELARGSSIDGIGYWALVALGIALICFIIAAIAKKRQ
ncbi:hypothetical protein [Streptomyces sp. UH6]|uniref:hypothetical protein n=1 Tax=Streptomyces sp. UH6 TaxID=2748379 RepID=UPI0015D4851D|nr:hypothetical protein [Streptomyces sp. UH6]NYV72914.1 hypothetical protein [Streptomyces sp. UH6]